MSKLKFHISLLSLVFLFFGACSSDKKSSDEADSFESAENSSFEKIRVANYNVENLFDLEYQKSEYSAYVPNSSSGWNEKIYKIKLENISSVIATVNPDIIALQEIESKQALLDLRQELKRRGIFYPYYEIAQKRGTLTSVKTAVLSKIRAKYSKEIDAPKRSKVRNTLEVGFDIKSKSETSELIIFVNHWKSKGMNGFESKRIRSAKILKARIDELSDDSAFIITGDLNSNYDEHKTFLNNKYLNDTKGITGINHILRTVEGSEATNNRFIGYTSLKNQKENEYLYNLWLELPESERWSHKFGGKLGTLDNMIISKGLADGKGVEYKGKSFNVFRGGGTVDRKGRIYRWQTDKETKQHLGEGYSDHLLIYADFEVK